MALFDSQNKTCYNQSRKNATNSVLECEKVYKSNQGCCQVSINKTIGRSKFKIMWTNVGVNILNS